MPPRFPVVVALLLAVVLLAGGAPARSGRGIGR
jgi:hypothetical protein